jgi:serine protease Do
MRMTNSLNASIVLMGTSLLCVAQTSPKPGDGTLAALSRSFEQMVAHVTPTVVQVLVRGLSERSSGSGVIVDPAGYIITNAHVVGLSKHVQVLVAGQQGDPPHPTSVLKRAGRLMTANVVGFDRETDLAVLKIEAQNLQAMPFGDSERLHQGQLVFAFGSPYGLENSVSMGIISSAARQVQPDGPMIYVQTDAPINPGNSGGPLVDSSGAIVGINTFIVSASGSSAGVGFAAPSNIVHTIYDQIRKTGTVKRGQIGAKVQTITPELAAALELKQEWGVLVADVTPRSSAEVAGLEIKDVLLTLNGKVLENARQFDVNIYGKAGETVDVELLRGGEKVTKQIAVLERPADREQLLSKVQGVLVARLGVLAVDLDEKITPFLPELRRLAGVVVAGYGARNSADGLAPGDVIYTVNGAKITSVKELEASLAAMQPGQSIAAQIERAGQLQFVVIEVQ